MFDGARIVQDGRSAALLKAPYKNPGDGVQGQSPWHAGKCRGGARVRTSFALAQPAPGLHMSRQEAHKNVKLGHMSPAGAE